MVEHAADRGRLVRRAAGLGAAVLFFSGFLVALGLGELVAAAGLIAAFGASAALATILLARHRARIARGAATAYAVAVPALLRLTQRTRTLARRLALAAARGGRHVRDRARPAAERAWTRLQAGIRLARDGAAPAARRARRYASAALHTAGSAIARAASRIASVVAADLAAYRQRPRTTTRRPPGRRRSALPPAPGGVGWDSTDDELLLDTFDDIEPAAARRDLTLR